MLITTPSVLPPARLVQLTEVELLPFTVGCRLTTTPHSRVYVHPFMPLLPDANVIVLTGLPQGGVPDLEMEIENALSRDIVPQYRLFLPGTGPWLDLEVSLRIHGYHRSDILLYYRPACTTPPPSPTLQVRELKTPADMAILDQLDQEALRGQPGDIRQIRFMLATRRRELTQELRVRWWLSTLEGTVVGSVGTFTTGDITSIQSLQTRPAFQRRGLARDLMLRVLGEGTQVEEGGTSLLVAEDNLPAMGLYQMLGFQEVGRVRLMTRAR